MTLCGLFTGGCGRVLACSMRGLAALATSLGGQSAILGKAALFAGNAGTTLAGNLALSDRIHRSKASFGDPRRFGRLFGGHLGPFLRRCFVAGLNPAKRFRFRKHTSFYGMTFQPMPTNPAATLAQTIARVGDMSGRVSAVVKTSKADEATRDTPRHAH